MQFLNNQRVWSDNLAFLVYAKLMTAFQFIVIVLYQFYKKNLKIWKTSKPNIIGLKNLKFIRLEKLLKFILVKKIMVL